MTEKPGGSSVFFLSVGYCKNSLPKGLVETYSVPPECLSFYVEKRKAKLAKRPKIPIDNVSPKLYVHVHVFGVHVRMV